MLTKPQKVQRIEEGERLFDKSQSLIFVDFSGKSVENVTALRRALGAADATFKVIKKRLLRIVFEKKGASVNPEDFASQVGTVFAAGDISTVAAPVYKSGFLILGGYAMDAKSFLDGPTVQSIGKLPSREALLGQLAGMLASPLRMFMFILQEKSKRS